MRSAVTLILSISFVAIVVGERPAFAAEELSKGGWLSGTLRLVRGQQADGSRVEAYQIVSAPRQMATGDDFCLNPEAKPRTFHLFAKSDTDRVELSRFLGKKLRVRVWDLFCSQSAWRIGDVGVSQWSWK